MPSYFPPQTFVDGQVVGRAQLGVLLDNDRYFHGLCDGWKVISAGVIKMLVGSSEVIFDGYHLLRSDAKSLHYYIEAGEDAVVDLYYGGALIATANNGTPVQSGIYDLSAWDPDLYPVYIRNRGAEFSVGKCSAPYTVYTGGKSYTAPPTITDGNVSDVDDFNIWVDNDAFFNDETPPEPAFLAFQGGFNGDDTSIEVWHGWICHRHGRIRYHIDLRPEDRPADSNDNRLKIIYGFGDPLQEVVLEATDPGEVESYHDLVNAFVGGTWYLVVVQLTRDDGNLYGQDSRVHYIMASPVAADAGFTDQGQLAVGQYVYGSTAGQATRLQLLSDNDDNIYSRLDRRDFAVRKPEDWETPDDPPREWWYTLLHRYSTLYYRGGGTLTYGDGETATIPDMSAEYGVYNLQAIQNLAFGQMYTLDGSFEFAMEAP